MREKMICPACGGEMNCHAEKLIYMETEPTRDGAVGGSIAEFHACPLCGRTESRSSREHVID